MEAYPYADDVSLILSNYWKTPDDKRADLPGLELIERIRELVEAAFNGNPDFTGFMKDFIAKRGDKGMIAEFNERLKYLMLNDASLAGNLGSLTEEFKSKFSGGGSVNIERGESTVSGSTAQIKQDINIQIDTINASKFVDQ